MLFISFVSCLIELSLLPNTYLVFVLLVSPPLIALEEDFLCFINVDAPYGLA